jgi:hypothetical protein
MKDKLRAGTITSSRLSFWKKIKSENLNIDISLAKIDEH